MVAITVLLYMNRAVKANREAGDDVQGDRDAECGYQDEAREECKTRFRRSWKLA